MLYHSDQGKWAQSQLVSSSFEWEMQIAGSFIIAFTCRISHVARVIIPRKIGQFGQLADHCWQKCIQTLKCSVAWAKSSGDRSTHTNTNRELQPWAGSTQALIGSHISNSSLSWANGEAPIHWDMIQLSINVHWTQSVYWTMTTYPQQLNLLFKGKWEKDVYPWIHNLFLDSSIWSIFKSNTRVYFFKRRIECITLNDYVPESAHVCRSPCLSHVSYRC